MNNTPIDKDRLKKELSFGKRAVSITSGITTGTPVKRFNDMSTPIEKIEIEKHIASETLGDVYVDVISLVKKVNEVIDAWNKERCEHRPVKIIQTGNVYKTMCAKCHEYID